VSGGEEEAETSTASDDSGNGPWTVVTSPSHRRHDSVEATSRPLPVPEEPLEGEEDTAAAAPREVCIFDFRVHDLKKAWPKCQIEGPQKVMTGFEPYSHSAWHDVKHG